VLRFIVDYIDAHGYSPSYAEIADGLGYRSKGPVSSHVWALQRDGYIRVSGKRQWRAIELTRKASAPPKAVSDERLAEMLVNVFNQIDEYKRKHGDNNAN